MTKQKFQSQAAKFTLPKMAIACPQLAGITASLALKWAIGMGDKQDIIAI